MHYNTPLLTHLVFLIFEPTQFGPCPLQEEEEGAAIGVQTYKE